MFACSNPENTETEPRERSTVIDPQINAYKKAQGVDKLIQDRALENQQQIQKSLDE